MDRSLEFDVWGGDWGLASIDLKTLKVLTLAKMHQLNYNIRRTNNPFRTPNGTLPVLTCGEVVLDNEDDIAEYLKRNTRPESRLSPSENADAEAYIRMLQEKLYPLIQYTWWVDARNCTELTRPWYCKAIPFPFNYYYPGKYEKEARSMIEALFEISDLSMIESVLNIKAEICLNALSSKLGDKHYFFTRPSVLDATVYAYLAPMLKVPFASSTLQQLIKNNNNLVAFVARMSAKYFTEYIPPPFESSRRNPLGAEGDEIPFKRSRQIFAVLFATVCMTCYALAAGIIPVARKRIESKESRRDRYQDIFEHAEGEDG